MVEIDAERVYAGMAPLFADWVRSLEELYEGYTDEQLELILRFLTEVARRQQAAAGQAHPVRNTPLRSRPIRA